MINKIKNRFFFIKCIRGVYMILYKSLILKKFNVYQVYFYY